MTIQSYWLFLKTNHKQMPCCDKREPRVDKSLAREFLVGKLDRKTHVPSKSSYQKTHIAQSVTKWVWIQLNNLKWVPINAELCNLFGSNLMMGGVTMFFLFLCVQSIIQDGCKSNEVTITLSSPFTTALTQSSWRGFKGCRREFTHLWLVSKMKSL